MKTKNHTGAGLPHYTTDCAGTSQTTYRKTDFVGDPYIFDFIGTRCPDPSQFFASDVDLVLRTRDGGLMLIEVKRKGAAVKPHQAVMYRILDKALRALHGQRVHIALKDGSAVTINVDYKGVHVLTFENTTFEDGAVYFDGHPVTADQVADIFAMR
jgi:hypothetical protein